MKTYLKNIRVWSSQAMGLGLLGTVAAFSAATLGVTHLVTDAAGFVTGQEFVVDGGWHG